MPMPQFFTDNATLISIPISIWVTHNIHTEIRTEGGGRRIMQLQDTKKDDDEQPAT